MGGCEIRRRQLRRIYGISAGKSAKRCVAGVGGLSSIAMPASPGTELPGAKPGTTSILTVPCPKPARFNEIRRQLNGITHKALADAPKRLERNGLVARTVLPAAPIGVESAITPLGHSLRQPFEAFCAWALAHGPEIERASASFEQAKAGQ